MHNGYLARVNDTPRRGEQIGRPLGGRLQARSQQPAADDAPGGERGSTRLIMSASLRQIA
jgi:hypothetical protein